MGVETKFRKLPDPLPAPGCYSLDLYCDHENPDHEWEEFPHNYINELGSRCRSIARRRGWKIHRDGTATCPKCVKRLAQGEKPA